MCHIKTIQNSQRDVVAVVVVVSHPQIMASSFSGGAFFADTDSNRLSIVGSVISFDETPTGGTTSGYSIDMETGASTLGATTVDSLTDGTLNITSGAITNAASLTAVARLVATGEVSGNSFTDGTLDVQAGSITDAVGISGASGSLDLTNGYLTLASLVLNGKGMIGQYEELELDDNSVDPTHTIADDTVVFAVVPKVGFYNDNPINPNRAELTFPGASGRDPGKILIVINQTSRDTHDEYLADFRVPAKGASIFVACNSDIGWALAFKYAP